MGHRSKAIERDQEAHGLSVERAAALAVMPAGLDPQVALRAAQANCTILLTGETGVGKGFVARWIHEHSQRRAFPFVPVNCGAIPDTLIDSQLFGHVRGAFSGATHNHLGLIRAANSGTLLLDEISELPLSAQNRLLRLLQEREVQPVGECRPVIVDVRVIAATNADLAAAVARQRFREDLLFRIDVVRLNVLPLRKRVNDLPQLLDAFNLELAHLYQQPALAFEPGAIDLLMSYHWPGNVRQLRTLVERLHVLAPAQTISPAIVLELGQLTPAPRAADGLGTIQQIKLEKVRQVLAETGGSVARAAGVFGVHRSTIYRWMRGL